jgi:hypothetical protein
MVGSAQLFDRAAATMRRADRSHARDDRELVRLATLAASSHNTQPWLFRPTAESIAIHSDRSRRCPVVDPDDAHLYRSLGCAAENLRHAASLQGLAATSRYDPVVDAVVVGFEDRPGVVPTDLSRALGTRQTTRTAYDGTSIDATTLDALARSGSNEAVRCLLVTEEVRAAAMVCPPTARRRRANAPLTATG